jgi:succinoglycan biosynthesis protein ExoA
MFQFAYQKVFRMEFKDYDNYQNMGKKVSVILPVRNESEHIKSCLEAVINQDYPPTLMEIIVVDGDSTDDTKSIVNSYMKLHPNLRLLNNPDKIVPTALNKGIQEASGDIIIRVDGHTIIEPDYVSECVKALVRTRADNVGGKMTGHGRTPFGESVVLATSHPFGIGNSRFHYSNKEENVDSVYLGAWPKDVFQKVGLFNEEMVRDQDDEFNYRLRKFGGRIMLVPEIRSVYTVRGSPKKLWKQYFEYGYWKVKVFQSHPHQMSYRHFIPAMLVAMLAVLPAAGFFSRTARNLLILITSLYLGVNLFSSARIARMNGWNHFRRLPFIFGIIHFSYGAGFLSGLLKNWLIDSSEEIRS